MSPMTQLLPQAGSEEHLSTRARGRAEEQGQAAHARGGSGYGTSRSPSAWPNPLLGESPTKDQRSEADPVPAVSVIAAGEVRLDVASDASGSAARSGESGKRRGKSRRESSRPRNAVAEKGSIFNFEPAVFLESLFSKDCGAQKPAETVGAGNAIRSSRRCRHGGGGGAAKKNNDAEKPSNMECMTQSKDSNADTTPEVTRAVSAEAERASQVLAASTPMIVGRALLAPEETQSQCPARLAPLQECGGGIGEGGGSAGTQPRPLPCSVEALGQGQARGRTAREPSCMPTSATIEPKSTEAAATAAAAAAAAAVAAQSDPSDDRTSTVSVGSNDVGATFRETPSFEVSAGKESDPLRCMAVAEAHERMKGKMGYNVATPVMLQYDGFSDRSRSTSPMKTKVPLSSLSNSHSPLVVRLTRVRDLTIAQHCPTQPTECGAAQLNTCIQEYETLCKQLREQRVIGRGRHADWAALFRWYAPYSLAAAAYALFVALVVGSSEALLISTLVFIVMPLAHSARLVWWNRVLVSAVDQGAACQFQSQLRNQIGWGANDSVLFTTLGAAMGALQKPRALLFSRPRECLHRGPLIWAAAMSMPLFFLRALRCAGIPYWCEVEASAALLAVIILTFIGCAPHGIKARAVEADQRLVALETALNALLDSLRPLLGDVRGGGLPSPPVLGTGIAQPPRERYFSVRLLTEDRRTLRAALVVYCTESGPMMCISCALADFCVLGRRVDCATATDLGPCGPVVVADSPCSGAPWPGGGQTPLSVAALTAHVGVSLGGEQRPRRVRGDDEVSVSAASVSTASTLRRGGAHQPDEVSLRLAVAMITAICSRASEPLEIFRPTVSGAVLPPKSKSDEPALLLGLPENRLYLAAGVEPLAGVSSCNLPYPRCPSRINIWRWPVLCKAAKHAHTALCRRGGWLPVRKEIGMKDIFGVVRTPMELHALLVARGDSFDEEVASQMEAPIAEARNGSGRRMSTCSPRHSEPSPWSDDSRHDMGRESLARSVDASTGSGLVEGGVGFPGSVEDGTALKHVVVIFDSTADRDHCLTVLREAELLQPEEALDSCA